MSAPAKPASRPAESRAVRVRASEAEDRWLPWVLVAVLLSRVPLLGGGFGSSAEAWRNAVAALHMRELGRYLPFRMPSFPVFEGFTALLIPGGSFATNAAAAVASLVAVLAFVRVARRAGIARPFWPTVAFAFGAPLWVSATMTIDFAFGLAFVLFAYSTALDRRGAWTGLLLALAAGCRPILWLLFPPMLVVLLARGAKPGTVGRFAVTFVVVSVVLAVLVLANAPPGQFGGSLGYRFQHLVTPQVIVPVLRRAAVFSLGKLGTLVAVLGLIAAMIFRRARKTTPAHPDHAPVLFELAAVAIILAGYLLVPTGGAYLIGVVPFLLLLLARALSPAWLMAASLAIASESLVTPQLAAHRLEPGHLFAELAARASDRAAVAGLLSSRPSEPTVREVGRLAVHELLFREPTFARTAAAWAPFRRPTGVALWSPDRRLGFAAALEPAQRDSLAAAGYRVVPDSTLRR